MQIVKDVDMQVIRKPSEAERFREYHKSPQYKEYNRTRMRRTRAGTMPEFYCVDSEGIGQNKSHRAVLVSIFNRDGIGEHYTARDRRRGLQWDEVFEFLYAQYQLHPRAAFVGFYLGYDFNQWLKSLPQHQAWQLLTKAGKASRRLPKMQGRSKYRSVKVGRWEIDALGLKRLSIRPRPEGCTCYEKAIKCTHKQLPWMHICDAGPFYQMSFLAVLDPARWQDDPEGWPVTQAEYDKILEGKNRRSDARLDKKMLEYNMLENIVLSRVMDRLARGFASVGIKIAKDQWYGPGSTASKWLQMKGAPKRAQLNTKGKWGARLIPKDFTEACHHSYFGGWFEIFSHGIIPGTSYNYDINNAYPYASSKCPHICRDCQFLRGKGTYDGNGEYVLLYCTVRAKGDRIGPVPHRDRTGGIFRPSVSKGWYWKHEIDAADRAGLVKSIKTEEWREFVPCNHAPPLAEIRDLYNKRLEIGKDSATGMAIKLNNNSVYGKFAQSIGAAPYNNWFYASYITSHCRTQILDAIGSHPSKANAVLMVATDGICFDSPHPGLPISKKLGEWGYSEYTELVLFKPGVYWHKEGKERLLKVKSRGVPRDDFREACGQAEAKFAIFSREASHPFYIKYKRAFGEHLMSPMTAPIIESDEFEWGTTLAWPSFTVPCRFRMRTCLSALSQNNWEGAAEVLDEIWLLQDSDPSSKRALPRWNTAKSRIDTVMRELDIKECQTYYHGEAELPKARELGFGPDGATAFGPILEAMGALTGSPVNYNLPSFDLADYEIEVVWGE